jgi:DUF438 domain-containing protein
MSELLGNNQNRILVIKGLIKGLSMGLEINETKQRFSGIIRDITPLEIETAEAELISEGMDKKVIDRLRKDIQAIINHKNDKSQSLASPGHPVNILMSEHTRLAEISDSLEELISVIEKEGHLKEFGINHQKLVEIKKLLSESEKHYQREENVLFAYIEKHGLTGPPRAMWMEHDELRIIEKNLFNLIDSYPRKDVDNFIAILKTLSRDLNAVFHSHFQKENNILFVAAMRMLSWLEWVEIRKEFDEIGYAQFTPKDAIVPLEGQSEIEDTQQPEGGFISETGKLSGEQLEAILNTLPFDLTFIDETDTVCYFNMQPDQLFPRSKAAIGRKVQNCHPEKSVHIVNQILMDFKSGDRDVADFWIDMKERKIYIRYFAVRDKNGKYLGCVEVTQDIADIKDIEGQKRLL